MDGWRRELGQEAPTAFEMTSGVVARVERLGDKLEIAMIPRKVRKAILGWVVLSVCAVWMTAPLAATVLVMKTPGERSQSIDAVEFIAQHYGIALREIAVEQGAAAAISLEENVRGIVVSSDAVSAPSWPEYEREVLESSQLKTVPVLFVDVFDKAAQREKADFAEYGLRTRTIPATQGASFNCRIVGAAEIGKELVGVTLPCGKGAGDAFFYFERQPEQGRGIETIMDVSIFGGEERYPVFVRAVSPRREVFLLTRSPITPNDEKGLAQSLAATFGSFAPAAIFLRHVAGEYGWHTDGYYANLTVDDPWLREPYGNFSYQLALRDMETNGFHTTIAFVPWNFDRSDAAVASLFQKHPDRFSLSMHGNNHDHEEFSEGGTVESYEADIRQGLARMKELSKRTGLEFDRVMVFPHRIAPASVVALLRKQGFACTVNLQNRLHDFGGSRPVHLWESFVASEEGIPSLKRELPNTGREYFAILAFLQTPILVGTHQDYFVARRFGDVAQLINDLRPDVRWVGLGSVCEKLYLKKLEDDGRYRVLLLGGKTRIENPKKERRTFVMEKLDSAKIGIVDVLVNGERVAAGATEGGIEFEVAINGYGSAIVETKYADEEEGSVPVQIAKQDVRVWTLRYASDFRDIVLSRTELGRRLNNAYYSRMQGSFSRVDAIMLYVAIAIIGVLVAFAVLVSMKRRRGRS